jgi:hypothetical protein
MGFMNLDEISWATLFDDVQCVLLTRHSGRWERIMHQSIIRCLSTSLIQIPTFVLYQFVQNKT